MDFFWPDLRSAARSLRKAPGFTSVAVLTLALGIGANTAIFSVVYGVLLRPFACRAPESLVIVSAERAFGGQVRRANFSALELDGWRGRARTLESIAMWGGTGYGLATDAGTRPINAAFVSDQFFSTLDAPMALGRPIGPADGRARAAIISHRLWTREYGASPQTLGRSIILNARPYIVVGVARPDFQFPSDRVDVWTPLGYAQALGAESWVNNPRGGGFTIIARMRAGITLERAREDADAVARSLVSEFPQISAGRRPLVVGLMEWVTGSARPALLMLLAAVGLVLIVACVNAMNLLLARQASRSQDMAVRRALGASPGRLFAFAVAECSLIALAGGAAGVCLAALGVKVFAGMWPALMPRADAVHVDRLVLLFALGLSMLTAACCAIGPALRCLGNDLAIGLKQGRVTQSRAGRRLRSTLVVVELAASVVLLVGAVLLGRSLVRLLHSDIGVTTDRVVVAEMDLALGRAIAPSQQIDAVNRVLESVAAIPGVLRASVTTSLPMNGTRLRYTLKDVNTGDGRISDYDVDALATTPEFFSALGVRLIEGRFFTAADDGIHQPVMIMSARTARRFFGDRDPIGRVLSLPARGRPAGREDVTLVGIVGDIKYEGLDAAADGGIYRPFQQQPWTFTYLVAQTSGEPLAVAGALHRQIADVDRQIAVNEVRALDEVLSQAAAQPRFRTVLLVALAALALALASIGLYGAVAYSVSLRTAELGIRIALGASRADVVAMVVGEGIRLAAVGAVVGMFGAFGLTRVIATLLYGVAPTDAVSFVAAPAGLMLLAAVASYVPARRAAAVDPIVALRAE